MERQQEIHRHTEGELPEVKIFNLLSSVGNGENKALELIAMRKGVIYSRGDLYKEVMNHQEKDKGWRMNRSTPFNHCQYSLSPIGLVIKESLSPDHTAWGYEITEYGLQTGVPFAGLLLKWSYEHPNHSLYKTFGATVSSRTKDERSLDRKRAPETRYKILREIAANPNNKIRRIDIALATSESPTSIGQHLRSLSENGIVSYESIEQGKPHSSFRRESPQDKELKHHESFKKLSPRVYDLLTNEYLSLEEIVYSLVKEDPSRWDSDVKKKSLMNTVSTILSHFERQGHIEREKFGYGLESELSLSNEQREAIVSLVIFIDKFRNGDKQAIEEGRSFAQRVVSDPNLFSELMLKAKEASPSANKTNAEDMHAYLISILYAYPNSTVNQIRELLEEIYDKRLGATGIRVHLSVLVSDGKIVSDPTKSGNVYRVADLDNQVIPSN